MPSDIRLSDFKRWFSKFGVVFTPGGKHLSAHRVIEGRTYAYTIPTVNGRCVKYFYLEKTRKSLKLTADDGIGDEHFR